MSFLGLYLILTSMSFLRTKMYAGHIVCCPLLSHVECAPRALLRLEKEGTDRPLDGRTDVKPLLTLTAR